MSLSASQSGSSTPLSPTDTLCASPAPPSKNITHATAQNVYHNALVPASHIIEFIASRAQESSTVYVYDLAEQAGFGTLTKVWSKSGGETAPVVTVQTRAGAGLSLVGRLSEGTSQDTVKGAVLTAYVSLNGLSMMAPALSNLPPATPTSRLVIQVPVLTPIEETFSLSASLAALSTALPILPDNVVILVSATPQEAVDFAQLSYKMTSIHVIHLFDHHSSSRELGHSLVPLSGKKITGSTVAEVIAQAGYSFFSYAGDAEAETVVVLINGPLALVAQALASRVKGLGVVTVSVLRPWDEAALREILPKTVKTVHVLDDVPNAATQGALYVDVFGTLLQSDTQVTVRAHRVTPALGQTYLSKERSFVDFLATLAPAATKNPSLINSSNTKKLLLFSTPKSSLSSLPYVIEDVFLSNKNISARLLVDHDVFSKSAGVTASRILLSPKAETKAHIPLPIALPLDGSIDGEGVDFIGILDHNLLKSHSIVKYAKPQSTILVVTTWSEDELLANLPADVSSLINVQNIRLFIINANSVASNFAASGPINDSIQNLVVHLAFLRLYMGHAADEVRVLKVARAAWEDVVQGIDLQKINSQAWAALLEVEVLSSETTASDKAPPPPLKEFSFNAVAIEADEGETVLNGTCLCSWHDAAKHLLFPEVFAPPFEIPAFPEEYPQNPALRPEVPDRTYLVTCTVNRRLTPKEYDRNVFHLEFDTNGTGLKYEIGEALGIHGWNDEEEVLDFTTWYGVDPNRLITIPVVNGEDRMHTRTVFQALQQQIDLFGRPPKSFYTDLAAYATESVERHALLFIGAAEGVATFKKLSEKDTVTFADVLKMYPSAKPGIETLCQMVGDIKPRHYSIASAQSVVGNQVDLLIVTVDWLTPGGE